MKGKYLFSLIVMVLLMAAPDSAWAGKYIKDVAIAVRDKKDDALRDLRDNGYEIFDFNFNLGAWGSDIFLGYTTTDEPTEAITDLLIVRNSSYSPTMTHNGRTYYPVPVPAGNDTGDLNRGSGGWDIFLWYTKEGMQNGVVTGFNYTSDENSGGLVKFPDGNVADVNRGVPLSDTYYLELYKQLPVFSKLPIMDEMFKVENLGGQLYKIEVPVAALIDNPETGNSDTYVLGNGYKIVNQRWDENWNYLYDKDPATIALYAEKEDGSRDSIFTLSDLKSNNKDFYDYWTAGIRRRDKQYDFYNPNTFEKMFQKPGDFIDQIFGNTHGYKFDNLVITSSDKVDRVWATIICKLPENYEKFGLKATGSINYAEGSLGIDLELNTLANKAEAPFGINNMMLVGPILNMRIDDSDKSQNLPLQPQGTQLAYVVSNNKISRVALWDAQKKDFVLNQTLDDIDNFSLNIDSKDVTQRFTLLAVAGYTAEFPTTAKITAEPKVTYAVPIEAKAFHEIHDFKVDMTGKVDSIGTFSQTNKISWSVYNYKEEDLLEEDQFIIQRAHRPDFSDAQTIESLFLDDGEADASDNTKMNFTYEDTEEDGWYDINNDSTTQKVYYRVMRAVPYSLWNNKCSERYLQKDTITLDTELTGVKSISITKTPYFDDDKTVNVRVNLAPPTGVNIWDSEAEIVINRYSPDDEIFNGVDYAKRTITISGTEVKWDEALNTWYAEIEDVQSASYTHYYYNAIVSKAKSPYSLGTQNGVTSTEAEANACYSETLAPFRTVEASLGTVKGKVVVEWEVDEGVVDGFELTRKEYGSSEAPETLTLNNQKATSYIDDTAISGKVYEYTITAKCIVRDKTYTNSRTVYGWNPYFGTLSGRVQMPNGALVTGPVTISVATKDTVTVSECKIDGKVIMPGYKKCYKDAITTTDGTFSFESIPYISAGIDYEVAVDAYEADVEYAGQPGKTFGVRLNNALYQPKMDMVIADTKRFSGRVLYENSTMPVNECVFYLNGYPLLDANGKEVKTDNKGNFSFLLPAVDLTLQVRKPGHKYANDGFVEGVGSDVTTTSAHSFRPSRDYDGLILYDNTKVRLVGRLIGGDRQGKLPIGLGVSKNNLGDDLKLVMELEGDDAASILYLKDQPDVTSQKKTFTQTITGFLGDAKEINKTDVTVERKRIVVIPDVKTGEFCIDLAPAKYKITEMSAKGYPTLFAEGQGFEVLDITNDITKLDAEYVDRSNNEILSTTYNSRYQKVYHTNAKVTYTQEVLNIEQKILGSEKITEANLKGEKVTVTIAKYDKATDKVTYTFGYPVFQEGAKYQLIVSAHEDYYYNGDMTLVPDIVNLESGKLKVRNGLESSISEREYELNSQGRATIDVVAGNTTFSLTDEDALRSLTMQVLSNGYYYEAEPLRAFVTGSRESGKDVLTIDGAVTVLDVLHDPYGSKSYAYREKGTKYSWSRNIAINFKADFNLNFAWGNKAATNFGLWTGVASGGYAGGSTSASTLAAISLNVPLLNVTGSRSAKYDMVLKDRVVTSSDPSQVGAMADVYIGFVNTFDISREEVFCVIDNTTYQLVKPAIEAKAIRIVSEGKDEKGNPFYLAISEKLDPKPGKPREFIYTQRHILSTVIPNLVQQYMASILTGTKEEVQAIADAKKTVQYRLKDGKTLADDDCYEVVNPQYEFKKPAINPDSYISMITEWIDRITENEEWKVNATKSDKSYAQYSLSANQRLEHSEAAEWFEENWHGTPKIANFNLNNGSLDGALGLGLDVKWIPDKIKQHYKKSNTAESPHKVDVMENGAVKLNENGENMQTNFTCDVPGSSFQFTFSPDVDFSVSQQRSADVIYSAGRGYVLETNNDGYLDIDVYRAASQAYGLSQSGWDFVSGKSEDQEKASVHDYIFVVRGGAERNPWRAPDISLFYEAGTPLGASTMKIDNPKIYIDQPVMSNLPASEKAFFSVRLTNESEMPASTDFSKYSPSEFTLKIDDKSTADGAIITMDGMPLKAGVSFKIAPRQSITKTIQVERSGKAYDYDNIKLLFSDASNSLVDTSAVSIHYLPTSTPVRMVRPVDKWVMNTLSPMDDQGKYYIPIEVNGFDINYDNFDHIELQYKKQTEGDTKWVNLCSYYANKDLYNKASGEKAMIKSGTITHRFYGDADPMEMNYDLRAVSFCRLGTGFVTSTSNVMSGLKDTRCPAVFGVPKPTNGILTFQDVVSIPFNEPIAYNYLDETANFSVTGIVNGANATYDASLRFPEPKTDAEKIDVPVTRVERNISGSDFTWEGMVKLNGEQELANFMLICDNNIKTYTKNAYFYFSLDADALWAGTNGVVYGSEKLTESKYERLYNSLKQKLTHVAVTFAQGEDIKTAGEQVRFYIDGVEIPLKHVLGEDEKTSFGLDHEKFSCNAKGKMSMGYYMDGNMADVRLWDKALSVSEMNGYRNKTLSGQEPSLLCYWPMDEMQGNVLRDRANGADMVFNRQTWHMTADKHSLRIDGQAFMLQNTEKFLRYDNNDYTLMSWFTVDQNKTVADTVVIFRSGSSEDKESLTIYLDKENMVVNSRESEYSLAKREQVMDGQWHNFAVVANKSLNSVSLYFDGKLTNTVSGADFCGMQQGIQLGSKEFHGNIDNLSFWHLAFPANSLDKTLSLSPKGNEMGLVYFLPFERDTVNSQNMHEVVFSTYNEVITMTADGKPAPRKQAFDNKVLTSASLLAAMDDRDRFSPAKSRANVVNLPFSWTATSNELQINLLETASKINHQYVSVTVRGVEDLAGNALVNPQMMLVYVDRNVLNWDDPNVNVNLKYGEKAEVRSKLINKSGRNIHYTLQNNCSWMRLSQKNGTSLPLSYDDIDMEISDGLAPGEYYTTVYAVDEDNLSSPLTVHVIVEADEPEWTVTDDIAYNYTMNIMGRVKLKNEGGMEYYDTDKRDVVAAFYDGVCVGKANITVDKANNPMVNLTVLGNGNMVKAGTQRIITFLLWNAATNTTSVIVPNTEGNGIAFVNGAIVGCPPAEPVTFTPTNEEKQTWMLETGWNWVSLNIIPKNDIGINMLFDSDNGFSEGDVIMVNGQASEFMVETKLNGTTNRYWDHGLDAIHNTDKYTYQIYVHNPVKATIYGYGYKDEDRYIRLGAAPANGAIWCHLPYLLSVDQPINVAMSDFAKDRAKVGTVIKNRKLFAVMNSNGNWVGSLEYMHPGEGYFVKHMGNETINVKFTNTEKTAYSKPLNIMEMELEDEPEDFDAAAEMTSEARTMMPVIADVDDMGTFEDGDEIVAFAKGHAIGAAKVTQTEDGKQLFFISLNAEDGNIVRFAHVRSGEVLAKSSNGIVYDGNGVTGTLDVPYTIDFSKNASDNDDAYGINGEKYGKAEDVKYRQGLFIIGESKIAK